MGVGGWGGRPQLQARRGSCPGKQDQPGQFKTGEGRAKEGEGGRREGGGAKAMTAGRGNRLHKEVCLQKQTGTGGNWYNTVKINQYDLLSGGSRFRGRRFESINCCLTGGALDTHLPGRPSVDDRRRPSALHGCTGNSSRESLGGG